MASSAHYGLLDSLLLQKQGKICPWASAVVFKHTAQFAFRRTCCERKGVVLTIAKAAARVEVVKNAFEINLHPIAENVEIEERPQLEEAMGIERSIETIKNMFRSIEDGETSVSPYDTAWVARVPALDGSGKPQFPSCLEWIIHNQLADGSWGDSQLFHVRERILNTLGCVIALETWNVAPDEINQGLRFLQRHIPKINAGEGVYSLIGFEIIFPALMEDAKVMNLDLPYDDDILHKIYNERALKLKRIPMDILHTSPSTLLHSLEGLRDMVDWDKLRGLQSKNGSFLFSPASTACALQQTSDDNCARYLDKITKKHNGGGN